MKMNQAAKIGRPLRFFARFFRFLHSAVSCRWFDEDPHGLFDRSSRERFHIMPPRMQRGSTDSPGNLAFSSPYFFCFSTERKLPKPAKKLIGFEANWIGLRSIISQLENRFPTWRFQHWCTVETCLTSQDLRNFSTKRGKFYSNLS